MLELVTSRTEKTRLQKMFSDMVRRAWRNGETRRIVWRPDSIELDIVHEGKVWFASHKAGGEYSDGGTLRYWNSFGGYAEGGSLYIAVEINIPIDTDDRRVSGFFAKDPQTGTFYLMHDGGVGGGQKGVGRQAFLAHSNLKQIMIQQVGERPRMGVIVTPLDQDAIDAALSSFIRRVLVFKQAVKSGQLGDASSIDDSESSYPDYFREFSGKKTGARRREFEYETRHGDIVDAVRDWAIRHVHGGRAVKDRYVDLGIEDGGRIKALFEIKTSLNRQCVYTGIGQLLVHSRGKSLDLHLVLPDDGEVAPDLASCINRLGIKLIRFRLLGRKVMIRTKEGLTH